MNRLKAFLIASAVLAAAAPAAAQDGWRFLGAREIVAGAERSEVPVAGARRYGEVRLCARHYAVRFHLVEIGFQGGGSQEVRLRSIIAKDSCTGAIAVRGGRRELASVAFTYDAAGRDSGHAEVRVFAR